MLLLWKASLKAQLSGHYKIKVGDEWSPPV
jgi:hypothetical protein